MKAVNLILIVALMVAIGLVASSAMSSHHATPTLLIDYGSLDRLTADALREAERQAIAQPQSMQQWVALGDTLLVLGYTREAEQSLRHAAGLGKPTALLLDHWAIALERLGQMQSAIDKLTLAQHTDVAERRADYAYRIGRNYQRLDDPQSAETAYRSAMELPTARHELAKLLIRKGALAEAKLLVDGLADESPNALEPCLLAARIALAQGDLAGADQQTIRAERTAQQFPIHAPVRSLHDLRESIGLEGQVTAAADAMDEGRPIEARSLIESVLKVKWQPRVAPVLAFLNIQSGRIPQALAVIDEMDRRGGVSNITLAMRGEAQVRLGHPDLALPMWRRALVMAPMARLREQLASLLEQQGQTSEARLERAKSAHIAGSDAYRNNELDRAEAAMLGALQLDPKSAHSWYYLGRIHEAKGDIDAAEAAYEQCLGLNPNHGRAADAIATQRGELGGRLDLSALDLRAKSAR